MITQYSGSDQRSITGGYSSPPQDQQPVGSVALAGGEIERALKEARQLSNSLVEAVNILAGKLYPVSNTNYKTNSPLKDGNKLYSVPLAQQISEVSHSMTLSLETLQWLDGSIDFKGDGQLG